MVRTLYRIYLYTVWLLLLIFAAVATAVFLGTVLGGTPLNGSSATPPTRATLTQQLAFLVIAWVITATLGGLHYWLIRRDIRDDAGAARGPVRSLYLNTVEAGAVLAATPATAFAIAGLSSDTNGGQAGALAAGIAGFGLFALLELERRREPAAPGAALTLQRLHLYGVHLILLFIATSLWINALTQTLVTALTGAGQLPDVCAKPANIYEKCYLSGFGYVTQHLVWLWLAAIIASLSIALYAYLARGDTRSTLRQLLHFVGFGYGIIWVLVAIDHLAQLLLLAARGRAISPIDIVGPYDFIVPIVFGLVVVALYALWLGRDAVREPKEAHTFGLTTLAVMAVILAVPFWVGCGDVLYDLLERSVAGGNLITRETLASSIALVITGLGYVPLALRLRQQSRMLARPTPRRGMVLALLAAGTLTAAVGLAVTLYAVVTASAGVPLDNWQEIARSSGVALVIGLALAAIYGQRAIAEGLFRRQPAVPSAMSAGAAGAAGAVAREPAATQPGTQSATIPSTMLVAASAEADKPRQGIGEIVPARDVPVEGVLDELLAGSLTREEAASRIRDLITAGRR